MLEPPARIWGSMPLLIALRGAAAACRGDVEREQSTGEKEKPQ